jgi:hypothetical protein
LLRRGWTEKDLAARLKNDPAKLAIAAHVRTETTLWIKWIAARLQLGTSKSARAMLHQWMHTNEKPPKPILFAQLQFQPMVWKSLGRWAFGRGIWLTDFDAGQTGLPPHVRECSIEFTLWGYLGFKPLSVSSSLYFLAFPLANLAGYFA